jgi:hypothetical protein
MNAKVLNRVKCPDSGHFEKKKDIYAQIRYNIL